MSGPAGATAVRPGPWMGGACLLASVGVFALWPELWPPGSAGWMPLARTAAVLCFGWACAAWISVAAQDPAKPRWSDGISGGALLASMVCGLLAVVPTAMALGYGLGYRISGTDPAARRLSADGLLAFGLVLAAVWVAGRVRRLAQAESMTLLLLSCIVLWLGLMQPAGGGFAPLVRRASAWDDLSWWRWAVCTQLAMALLAVGATAVRFRAIRVRQERAWPHRLADLLVGPPRWPGYVEGVGLVAVMVLLLAVYELAAPRPPAAWIRPASALACLLTAAGCFHLMSPEWNANLFGLGATLCTAAVATLASMAVRYAEPVAYDVAFPAMLNAMVIALVLMSALWFWLPRLWQQQLHDGAAWTPAGHAIPYSWRMGFFTASLAALLAFEMAYWPLWPRIAAADNSALRWVCGLIGIALLYLVLHREAVRKDSSVVASLALMAVAAAVVFAAARWPDRVARGRLGQYAALPLAWGALPVLLASIAIRPTRRRAFAPPLRLAALLVLPACGLLQLVSTPRLPAPWLQPASLAGVAVVYGVAGLVERRRALAGLALVVFAATIAAVWRSRG